MPDIPPASVPPGQQDRLPHAPPFLVCAANVISLVMFMSEAVYDPTLTIGGYVALSLLMLWSLFVAFDAAWEMTRNAT